MKRGGPASRPRGASGRKRPLVLVFGESPHDTEALRNLVQGFRADLNGRVEPRRSPLVLIKNARPSHARSNAARIAAVVRQELAARNVLAVLAHEDCDAVEPAHERTAARIEQELTTAGCLAPAIGVAPAWEMEAWWLIFPEAVGKLVPGWRDPDDWLGKHVGLVRNAKEALKQAVRPPRDRQSGPRAYEERDSVRISLNIARDALLESFQKGVRTSLSDGKPRLTRSDSFEAFRMKILSIAKSA